MRLTQDLHTHTFFSHGTGSAEENVCVAIQKGLSRIAITEHAPGHLVYGVRGKKLLALREEVGRLKHKYGGSIEVLFGLECNLMGFGKSDAPKDRSGYDIIILGYHKGATARDGLALRALMEALGMGSAGPERMAEALLAAAEACRADIVSHPGLYAACNKAQLARGAAELGCLLELNGQRLTFSDEELVAAHAAGARFIINSDAHSPGRVGEGGACIQAAVRCGVAGAVVNLERHSP